MQVKVALLFTERVVGTEVKYKSFGLTGVARTCQTKFLLPGGGPRVFAPALRLGLQVCGRLA